MRSINAIQQNGIGAINIDAHIVVDAHRHSYRRARHLTAPATLWSLGGRLSALASMAMRGWLAPSTGPWQTTSCTTSSVEAAKPREAETGFFKRLVSPAVVAA